MHRSKSILPQLCVTPAQYRHLVKKLQDRNPDHQNNQKKHASQKYQSVVRPCKRTGCHFKI